MINDLKWYITKKDNYNIGICLSKKGLYACTIPLKDIKQVKSVIKNYNFPKAVIVTSEEEIPSVCYSIRDVIWEIWNGREAKLPAEVAIDFSLLTLKQITVLKTCLTIPKGTTMTYGQLAQKAGLPGAYRFVGTTMANNRLPLIIPCHRVVRHDGLGNYGGGVGIKQSLLLKEKSIEK